MEKQTEASIKHGNADGLEKEIIASIVIPTLNEEKRIADCLRAIRAQRFSGNFEIIVSDGLSEDKTVEIAKRYADKVVSEKVRSIAAERQRGAREAVGKLIAFTDADSLVDKNWLQEICNCLEDEKVAGVYGPVFFHDGSTIEKSMVRIILPAYLRVMAFLGMPSPIGSNLAIRKTVFEKTRGFNIELKTSEDLDLGRKIKKFGKFVYAKKAIVRVSCRRIKKWGYLKYALFHVSNAFKFYLTGKAHEKYENVR